MFRLTPEKAINRINKLIDELGQYDLRIADYEHQASLAQRMGISKSGDDLEIQEWRIVHDEIYDILCDARHAVYSGVIDVKVLNNQLRPLKKSIRNFKRVLDDTDKLGAAGRKAARKILSGN